MTSKIYIYVTTCIFVAISLIFIGLNIIFNDFGLFYSKEKIRIYGLEKTTKYLLSFKYIPENFNAVLIGSSVSANMNTSKINKFNVYNLSMNSGNMTELLYPIRNVLSSGKIECLLICLYDYTTKNNGVKGKQINKKEYYGSLYSILPIALMKDKLKALLRPEKDVFKNSYNGFNNFNITKKNINFLEISEEYMKTPRKCITIDPIAVRELNEIIDLAHKNNIQIYAYFYPIYKKWFEILNDEGNWKEYYSAISDVFSQEDIVWDMNTNEYDSISTNPKCYSDGHLSNFGVDEVIRIINKKLEKK